VSKVQQVQPALPARLVVHKVFKGTSALPDQRVLQVQQGLLVLLDPRDLLDQLVQQVLPVQRVLMVVKASKVFREFKEKLASKAFRVVKVV
jgi:hypothetical protein